LVSQLRRCPVFRLQPVQRYGSRRRPGAFFGVRAGRDRGGAEAPIGARFGPMPPEAEATYGAPDPAGIEAGKPGNAGRPSDGPKGRRRLGCAPVDRGGLPAGGSRTRGYFPEGLARRSRDGSLAPALTEEVTEVVHEPLLHLGEWDLAAELFL
jgi:hypothetical protein